MIDQVSEEKKELKIGTMIKILKPTVIEKKDEIIGVAEIGSEAVIVGKDKESGKTQLRFISGNLKDKTHLLDADVAGINHFSLSCFIVEDILIKMGLDDLIVTEKVAYLLEDWLKDIL